MTVVIDASVLVAVPVGSGREGSGTGRAFSVQRYGMLRWGGLFTARQKVTWVQFGQEVQHTPPILKFAA